MINKIVESIDELRKTTYPIYIWGVAEQQGA